MRKKDRIDTAEPKLMKSSTDNEDPRREHPNNDRVDPIRMKFRTDIALPNSHLSRIENGPAMTGKLFAVK
jgi:hypothetical protein